MPCSATALRCEAILAPVQDAAVHLGMQRLHPPVEHLGEAGEFGDVLHRDAGVAQQLGGAAGRDQFHAQAGKLAGELHQSGLVGHAENGTLDFRLGRGHGRPRMNWECAWERQEEILIRVSRQSSVVSRQCLRTTGQEPAMMPMLADERLAAVEIRRPELSCRMRVEVLTTDD